MNSSARASALRPQRVLRSDANAHLPAADTVSSRQAAALRLLGDPSSEDAVGEDLLAEARAAGYAEGRADGRAEALAAAESARAAATEAAAHSLVQAVATLAATRQGLVEEVTADALSLTYDLLATILGDETVVSAVPPRDVVTRALALAPAGADLIVRVPPGFALSRDELGAVCDLERIELREDPSIAPGGCVIDAGACRIDAQLESALARVRAVLAENSSEAARG